MLAGDNRTVSAPFVLPDAPAEADLVAKYFRGLGDATRVRILELLRDHGALSVGDLVARLGQSQSKVSNHLACLRWCGFVETRREHPSVYYKIADERVVKLLALGQALLEDNAEHVAATGGRESVLKRTAVDNHEARGTGRHVAIARPDVGLDEGDREPA